MRVSAFSHNLVRQLNGAGALWAHPASVSLVRLVSFQEALW